jgi:acetate kinase
LAKTIGALAVLLGRIDALVFTGGIGENSALIRHKTLARLSVFGFACDQGLNSEHGKNSGGLISSTNST